MFKLPESYFQPTEERLYFYICSNKECDWDSCDETLEYDQNDLAGISECPKCGHDVDIGSEWF